MRKILTNYLPVSLLLAFLAMVLLMCGGGGGDGGGSPKTLTGLSVSGPASMSEYGAATYTATASWDDNTTSTVMPAWSVNLQTASISTAGVLSCSRINADQAVTITATYSSGGVDETGTMDVTITDIATIPFTTEMVSGQAFFEEYTFGEDYLSFLSSFRADFSFDQYYYDGPPPPDTVTGGTSDYDTGTWTIDTFGNLVLTFSDQDTVTVGLISVSATELQAVFDEGTEPPPMGTLEIIVPVDPSKLPGTYAGDDDYTWVFNAGGTGSVPDFGDGLTFTWSMDTEGVLRMPADTGYTASFYVRPTSQSTATEYTVLRAGFTEHNTSTGAFYRYYGGIALTRQ